MKAVSTSWARNDDEILQPVSTGISFQDYSRMQTEQRAPSRHGRYIPTFAANDEQLRQVIAQRIWIYLHNGGDHGKVPDELAKDWQRLCRMADEFEEKMASRDISHMPKGQRELRQLHHEAVKRAGGYAALQSAIAYRSWRLRQYSVTVGVALGISPQNVRVSVQRMNDAARFLGFEVFPDHHTRGTKRARKARKSGMPVKRLPKRAAVTRIR